MAKSTSPKTSEPVVVETVEETPVQETQATEAATAAEETPAVEDTNETVEGVVQEESAPAPVVPQPVPVQPAIVKPVAPSTPFTRQVRQAVVMGERTRVDLLETVKTTYGNKAAENPQIKYLVATLGQYVEKMSKSSVIDEQQGGAMQARLADIYDTVLNLTPELSHIGINIIVSVIKDNLNDCFSDTMALRFANAMKINQQQALRFQMLTTLFVALARGTKKQDLGRRISIRKLVEYIPDRNAKENLMEYVS